MPIRPIIIIIIFIIIVIVVVVIIIIIIIIITSIIFVVVVVVVIIIIINRVYNLYWSFVFQSCINSLGNSFFTNKANLDLTAATGLVKFTQIGFKSTIFQPVWPCNLVNDLEKKNNRTPPQCYVKFCASFQINWWIQTGVTVRKCSIQVKIGDFVSLVTVTRCNIIGFCVRGQWKYFFVCLVEFNKSLLLNRPWCLVKFFHTISFMTWRQKWDATCSGNCGGRQESSWILVEGKVWIQRIWDAFGPAGASCAESPVLRGTLISNHG